jgi:large subunit ribosomal protein L27
MAHTKAAGAAKRNVNVAGKRLGIKKFAGEYVKPGNIILRQRGTKFHPGNNTMLGRDHTIFSVVEGYVSFRDMTGYKRAQKWVDVTALEAVAEVKPTKSTKAAKIETVETEDVVAEAKPAAKKTTPKPKAAKSVKASK